VSKNKRPALIYHGGCPDGFGSAYAFWKKYGDSIDYVPMNHNYDKFFGLDESFFSGRDIWMADIAMNRDDCIRAFEVANSFFILDHHASAERDLDGLDFCKFDMNHSGAMLSWNYCHPDDEAPILLRYIQDRDLHSQKLEYMSEILTAVDAYDHNFEDWDRLNSMLETKDGFSKLLIQGQAILSYNKTLIKKIKKGAYRGKISGYDVPMINSPFFRHEILLEISKGEPFAAAYHFDGEFFIFSMRRSDDNSVDIDLSEIASRFPNGGGHKKAAGFSIRSLDELDNV